MKHIKKTIFLFLGLMIVIIPLDQSSKNWSESNYLRHSDAIDLNIYQGTRDEILNVSVNQLDLSFGVSYVRNFGTTAGMLRTLDPTIRMPILLTLGAIFAIGMFFSACWLSQHNQWTPAIFLAIIVSAAFGNQLDRLRLGYVIDFLTIHFRWNSHKFIAPVFNVADVFLIVGMIGFISSLCFDNLSLKFFKKQNSN